MNTRKLLLIGMASLTLAGVAGLAQAKDTLRASMLVFPNIDVSAGKTTLIQIGNDRGAGVHVQCYWQDADKVKQRFDFTMTGNETFLFDAKSGRGFPRNTTAFMPASRLKKGELICFAIQREADADVYSMPISWNFLTGVARVVQYVAPGFVTEYQAWAQTASGTRNTPVPGLTQNPDGSWNLYLDNNSYDWCPRVLLGDLITRDSVINLGPRPPAAGGGTLEALENHVYVSICEQWLDQGAHDLYTKLEIQGYTAEEASFNYWQCGDTWYDVNLGSDAAPDPLWGPTSGNYQDFLNANVGGLGQYTVAERYQLSTARRADAIETCGCSRGSATRVICENDPSNPTAPYDGSWHPDQPGLLATQMGVYDLFPANDIDAAASNLHRQNTNRNGVLRVDLYEGAKQ